MWLTHFSTLAGRSQEGALEEEKEKEAQAGESGVRKGRRPSAVLNNRCAERKKYLSVPVLLSLSLSLSLSPRTLFSLCFVWRSSDN